MAKLSDIFNIVNGSNLSLSEMILTSSYDGIPFVSRTEKNNGISAYIKPNLNKKINSGHTLTVALGGSVLETFYQDTQYFTGYHIAVLSPKVKLTKEEMLFYAVCIKANKIKYSYGRQANRTLKDLIVPDYNNIPQFVYQHTFPKLIENEPAEKISLQDAKTWKEFTIKDLFVVSRGSSKPINEIESYDGKTPIVSSSEFDNGIRNFTDSCPTQKPNTITVAINGSVGSCFYQELAYIATNDVAILDPKFQINNNVALFIATILKTEISTKYSYGRKCGIDNLKNTVIKLPAINDLPDYKYISEFIDSLKKKFSI